MVEILVKLLLMQRNLQWKKILLTTIFTDCQLLQKCWQTCFIHVMLRSRCWKFWKGRSRTFYIRLR